MKKRCSVCHRNLPTERFHRMTKAKDGLQARCKECARSGVNEWHKSNPGKAAEYNKGRYKEWYARNKALVIERLGGVCIDCGLADHRVLDLHHSDRNGNTDRASGMTTGKLIRAVRDGLRKDIILLCCNCHRIRTHHQEQPTS